ncbi:MAG TPA: HD domain-containing phosphohydrolase, partial [Verrucomicrobiae bacterium]|nr:HD domain-containing phosphohydrolase [Verrucomicrobiae bacterium]
MQDIQGIFRRVVEFQSELSKIRDLDILLEKILYEARRFTAADAGSIYIRENDRLKFSQVQNDTLQSRLPPGKKLFFDTFTIPIDSGSIAGFVAQTGNPLNLPDVYELSTEYPFSFNRSYDEKASYRTTSMLTLPLKSYRGECVGVLQLINAREDSGRVVPFPPELESVIMHLADAAAAAVERAKLTRTIILRMNKLAELRDPLESGPHVHRVAAYSVILYENWALKKGIPEEEVTRNRDILRMAAMLHDVGKVGISDTILKKPARFTPEEYEIMKTHTLVGARLFGEIQSDFDEAAHVVALNHHERWDGNGYPGHVEGSAAGPEAMGPGKRGEEIPLFGRIVAIADVYDALSNRRCYKSAWSEEEVLEEIRKEAGKQFDPELVEVFLENVEALRHARSLYGD